MTAGEETRLGALRDLRVLDTAPEERFDRVVRLAQGLFRVPTVAVNLVDQDRQWTKASIGELPKELPRSQSFCAHTIQQGTTMVVPDALEDERFRANPLVVGDPGIRFYAGQPLTAPGGQRVGALCLIDSRPRTLSAVEERLLQDLADWVQKELALDEELLQAAEVQRRMLPRRPPDIPGYDVAAGCIPAREVGGDFYDWYSVGDRYQFVLGDVMGKGVAAALVAASVRAVVRGASRFNTIGEAVTRAGASMAPDLEEIGSFATLFCARLDGSTGKLEYVDAGHGLSLVVTRAGSVQPLRSEGLPLGVLPDQTWAANVTSLGPGDCLVSVSDGVLEAFPTIPEAIDALVRVRDATSGAQEMVDKICARAAGPHPADDVTAIAIRGLHA